jgi:hypothetical protein
MSMLYTFQAVSLPIIRSSKTTHSIGYMSSFLAATASVGEFELTHVSSSSKQAWHTLDVVSTVFELLIVGRRKTQKKMD